MEQIIILVALILSIVLHEMAHGYAAFWLGDPTAKLQGRLSGNPLVHIDPLGSVIIPGLLYFTGAGILFGWAKPVPYNPYNLSDQRYGEAKVAAAGPAMNLIIAFIFGTLIRFQDVLMLDSNFTFIASYIVFINILLALFNMIPVPPLDGSKIISAVLPFGAQLQYQKYLRAMERYGIIVFFLFIFIAIQFIWPYLFAAVANVAGWMTGLTPIQFMHLIQ